MSLGEGDTPVIELPRAAEELGLARLWAKLEFESPTGSFKDRGSSVLISVARERGVTEFVEDSSGNAGASLAAYAAAAGIRAHVFVPASAPAGKKGQIQVYGAVLHEIEGPRQAATDAARSYVAEKGLPWLSHNLSPFFAEGTKSFAYELADSPAAAAAHVLFPVGFGSLIIGAHRGYGELVEAGLTSHVPRLHCVQSEAFQPIVAAIAGAQWSVAPGATTVAGGIAAADPPRLPQVLDAVRTTGGAGVAARDESTLAWQQRLARTEGVFCEATAAVAFAGLEKLVESGVIGRGGEVVVPVTGSGLKEASGGP